MSNRPRFLGHSWINVSIRHAENWRFRTLQGFHTLSGFCHFGRISTPKSSISADINDFSDPYFVPVNKLKDLIRLHLLLGQVSAFSLRIFTVKAEIA